MRRPNGHPDPVNAPVSPRQLASQLRAIVEREPDLCAVAFHVRGGWAGEHALQIDDHRFEVRYCESALAVRECLLRAEADSRPVVIMTPLGDSELGLDVCARLYRQRVLRIDRWELVRQAFQAQEIDPRLPLEGWLAEALLEAVPQGGFPPVPSGWLDEDTVWRYLFAHYLGVDLARPDAQAILDWSLSRERVAAFERLDPAVRAGLGWRLAAGLGRLGEALVAAMKAGNGARLLATGLAAEVLFDGERRPGAELLQAAARLEPYLGGAALEPQVGRAWSEAAQSVFVRLPPDAARERAREAENLLAELRVPAAAKRSRLLPAGFEQALGDFAAALDQALEAGGSPAAAESALQRVLEHHEGRAHPVRIEALQMAMRLARYLAAPVPEPADADLAGLARRQAAEGGFVDWARRYLLGGDAHERLAAAFATLIERARVRREQENRAFATRFAEWSRRPGPRLGLIGIEQVLARFVEPLAQRVSVAVIVVDGMDWGVARELEQDLRERGWERWAPSAEERDSAVVGIVPSVTEFARASLLSGTVCRGASTAEKRNFAAHQGLLGASRGGRAPKLFHKGELSEGGTAGLSSQAREALADPDQRIVGIVLNAVDDHLAKSDQLRLQWAVSAVSPLEAILYAARVAGRAVVLASDHGHVLEYWGTALAGGSEERWRSAESEPAEQELVIEGPRVRAACGIERVIVPWSERVRYVTRKTGYHGGASVQEVVVPLLVFASEGDVLEGWLPVAREYPAWWHGEKPAFAAGPAVEAPPARFARRPQLAPEVVQPGLFEEAAEKPGWLDALLASPVYHRQRQMGGRLAPADALVRPVLDALDKRGDRAPLSVIAEALQQPEFRARGIVTGMQRLLNVDGYQVLTINEATGTVTLDRALLRTQFQLDG